MAAEQQKRNVVIIGGGIIGSTTAYFLTHHPSFNPAQHTVTLLEATAIAGGASGKAGGLLALWAYPECIVPLSYRLHKELAEEHGGKEKWGYRGVHCAQVDMRGVLAPAGAAEVKEKEQRKENAVSLQKRDTKALNRLRAAGVPEDLDWIAPEGLQGYEEMGDPSTTAQVHPYLFTTSMASLAEEKGAKIVFGSATEITQANGAVTGVNYRAKDTGEAESLQADTVILTAGPWTRTVYPPAPIDALRAHSVTIRPSRPVSAFALFTSIALPASSSPNGSRTKRRPQTVTPEIYARPNNEVYACGEGDTLIPLPTASDLVVVDPARCQDIVDHVSTISPELRDGTVTARQACYLPNVSRRSPQGGGSGPLVGETSVKGLLIGAGHTCWGIQNGPGTGKCLSEIVWEGAVKSARLEALDPRRWGL